MAQTNNIESTSFRPVRVEFTDDHYAQLPQFQVHKDGSVYHCKDSKFERVPLWLDLECRKWILLPHEGKLQAYPLNRVIASSFHGNCPSSSHMCGHKNGKRSDCSADNCRWMTRPELAKCPRFYKKTVVRPSLLDQEESPILHLCRQYNVTAELTQDGAMKVIHGHLSGTEAKVLKFDLRADLRTQQLAKTTQASGFLLITQKNPLRNITKHTQCIEVQLTDD
jgi:hypothetical protein